MSSPPKNPFDQFMEETEELLAPFKLITRIARRCRAQSAAIPHRSVSRFRKFLGWDGFSFVFFTFLAFAFLGLPFQYDKARVCFIAAAIALVIKIVHSVDVGVYPRLLITLLAAILSGLAVNRVNDWVSKLELEAMAREVPQRPIVVVRSPAPAPLAPARSYLVFDGVMRFGERRDNLGQLGADQNLHVGEQLSFNYYYKATGPNGVMIDGSSRWTDVAPDFSPETQQRMIAHFKAVVEKEKKEHPTKPKYSLLMPQDSGHWDSAYAWMEDKTPRLITETDLARLKAGTEIAFVLVEISYMDNKKLHHLRTCQFLQPPAIAPGIWHFCDGFVNPD